LAGRYALMGEQDLETLARDRGGAPSR